MSGTEGGATPQFEIPTEELPSYIAQDQERGDDSGAATLALDISATTNTNQQHAAIEGILAEYAGVSRGLGLVIGVGNTVLMLAQEKPSIPSLVGTGLTTIASVALCFGPNAFKQRVMRRLNTPGNPR